MRYIYAVVTFLLLAAICSPAWAGGRRNRISRVDHAAASREAAARSLDAAVPSSAAARSAPRDPYAGRYPKFYGGFHSRELQNIGVPSGDVGLRGNGFSMFPW